MESCAFQLIKSIEGLKAFESIFEGLKAFKSILWPFTVELWHQVTLKKITELPWTARNFQYRAQL